MPSYHELLKQAYKKIENTDISQQATQILLLEMCGLSNHQLYVQFDEEVPQEIIARFNDAVDRLLKNEPLQYILGYQDFYGYKLLVDSRVLIPRYETEELVANVLADSDYFFPSQKEITIADIGTGSGNIAVSLKKEEARFRMYATDISNEALELARANAEKLNVDITFLQGDMLQPLIDSNIKVDILVSNPPYIPVHQEVQKSVEEYEPHVALYGGNDGLFFYRSIFENAHKVLKEKSFMAFEIGYDEKEAIIKELRKSFPDDSYEVLKDLNGKDRMLFVYHNL